MSQSHAFQDSLHSLLTWFLDPRSAVLDLEGEHRPRALASHLACGYRQLGPLEPAGRPVTKAPVRFDRDAYLQEDRAFRRRVVDLCDFVRTLESEYLSHFYLHGSLATLDYEKGWSDVDTFMVIRDDVVTDGGRLAALRQRCLEAWPLFLAITPLQHHGFIVATTGDLARYPSHYLPLPVFDHALAVLDGPPPVFHLTPGTEGSLRGLSERRDALDEAMRTGVLRHHPYRGVYLRSHFENAADGMRQLHALLDYLMLVPALLLDAMGESCYKRDSFAMARPHFSDDAWSIVDRASEIRRTWPIEHGLEFDGNAVPAWLQRLLGPDYIRDGWRLLDEAVRLVAVAA